MTDLGACQLCSMPVAERTITGGEVRERCELGCEVVRHCEPAEVHQMLMRSFGLDVPLAECERAVLDAQAVLAEERL